jgi:hypothetical protein
MPTVVAAILFCVKILGWAAVGAWSIGTGLDVTESWPMTAFWTGFALLAIQALARHTIARLTGQKSPYRDYDADEDGRRQE